MIGGQAENPTDQRLAPSAPVVRRRVVHVTTAHPIDDTRILLKECVGLSQRGHDVRLIVATDRPIAWHHGVRITPLRKRRRRLVRALVNGAQAFRAALRFGEPIVHVHDPEFLPWVPLLRLAGRTVVYDMHEELPKQVLGKHWIPRRWRRLVARFVRVGERVLLAGVPVVFAESSYVSAYPWVQEGTVVLNLPLAQLVGSPDRRLAEHPTVAYVGVVSASRGVLVVAAALEMLRGRAIDARFVCVGPIHPDVGAHPAFAQGVRDGWIDAPGRLAPGLAWERIATAHVGVAVLKPLPNYVASFPTKMFEYMAMGMPVVVSDFPLYRSVVASEACGRLVDPECVASVVSALGDILTSPADARAMGAAGVRAVRERYGWAGELDKLEALYARIDV